MSKEKKLISLPLIIVAIILVYCWTIILTTEILATWSQYLGLTLFIVIVFSFFKYNIKIATLLTGVYLLLATFNLLAITAEIATSWLRIGPVSTPPIQLLSFAIFVLYFCLNMDPMIDRYLDYKEAKSVKV